MIGLRAVAALALACGASAVAACSSSSGSSGSPTKFACADNSAMATMSSNQACTSCTESSCGSQASAAFGSGYASGDVSGGACSAYVGCIAPCACGDIKCVTSCTPSSDCQSATSSFVQCQSQNCASQCNNTTGGDGGTNPGGDGGILGGPPVACNMTGSGICISGLPAAACNGGTVTTSCPTAGLVGCCTAVGIETCSYMGTATDLMMTCSAENGTFSMQP